MESSKAAVLNSPGETGSSRDSNKYVDRVVDVLMRRNLLQDPTALPRTEIKSLVRDLIGLKSPMRLDLTSPNVANES